VTPKGTGSPEPPAAVRELWVHALAAKAGGGVTYLRAFVPELMAQLDGRGIRLVLLAPDALGWLERPEWVRVVGLPRVAGSALARMVFDQVVLPAWLKARRGAVLFCSGNVAPVLKAAPTAVLIRNAIYFEPEFLRREGWRRRLRLRLQGQLIRRGAAGARAHYPSRYMRSLLERDRSGRVPEGRVNYYGIASAFLEGPALREASARRDGPYRYLFVMNYTLQKNLTLVLEALTRAKAERLPVEVTVTSTLERGPRACADHDRRLIAEGRLVESGHLRLAGPQHGADLVALYRASDACLMPSFCESFAHPLVEAMALGLPLLCADRPYAHEICGEDAVYFDPHRPEELVRLWREWPAPLGRCRRRPRAELLQTFSWRAHVSRLLEDLGLAPA
jgi:glycosyltransferase involved in cell wall biosynthesis